MAESRITNVDYNNDLITYWYDDHKTHKRVTVTEHVFDLFAKISVTFLINILKLLDIMDYTVKSFIN